MYPLVNVYMAIENGPVEIVDLPIDSMVDLSHHLWDSLPEGRRYFSTFGVFDIHPISET